MSKKACYFKCKYEGPLYGFPPLSYTSYEKFYKWKDVLRKEDKEKSDYYISQHLKLCRNHFESYYLTPLNRLTRHAVPTLKLGITLQQEKLLCEFIEENPKIIMRYTTGEAMLDKMRNKWKAIGLQLNALGSQKTSVAWAEYLLEVMSSLKTKEVVWRNDNCTSGANKPLIRNTDDFTDLELKILQVWNNGNTGMDSPDHYESETEEIEIKMEDIEDGESDSSRDSDTSRVTWSSRTSRTGNVSRSSRRVNSTNKDNETADEVVTFTLNAPTGGLKPLLQATDIAPYEAPQDHLNITYKCNCSNSEVQDEFDAFGKDIAQQLRNMPIQTALETRKVLLSVLKIKQSKILNDSFLEY